MGMVGDTGIRTLKVAYLRCIGLLPGRTHQTTGHEIKNAVAVRRREDHALAIRREDGDTLPRQVIVWRETEHVLYRMLGNAFSRGKEAHIQRRDIIITSACRVGTQPTVRPGYRQKVVIYMVFLVERMGKAVGFTARHDIIAV